MNPSVDPNSVAKKHGVGALRAVIDQAKKWPQNSEANVDDSAWKPSPLPPSLLPVAPFKLELMPDKLRPWVADVCERMQCPADFVAVSLMVAAGSVIGRKVLVRPKQHDDWLVVPNQWALCIGRPGIMKSPAMEEALRPIKQLAAAGEEKFRTERAKFDVAAIVVKLRRDANYRKAASVLKDDPNADISSLLEEGAESEPTLRRYMANDTTVESLGVLLQQNPNGLLVYRDEMVSLLDSLDQEDQVSARGFYLSSWGGLSGYTFDRIGRGLHLSIDAVCLSMLGSTQPGRISQYLARAIRGGRGDDGLIQRFGLMVWPEINGEWRHVDKWPDRGARDAASTVFMNLDGLDWRAVGAQRDRGPTGDEEGPPFFRFSIDAYDEFVAWWTALERQLRTGEMHPALESHLAKYRKLMPGLALICHLIDTGSGPVTVNAVKKAIDWAAYLETHARRAYGSVTAAESDTARAILARIKSGHLPRKFTARDVWRPGWARLTDRVVVQAALNLLEDYDWLTSWRHETGGRPTTLYQVPDGVTF
jgi:putative DNA primase/helicase